MIDKLIVKCLGRVAGTLSFTPDGHLCAFEYAREWLVDGFSLSPLDLPLKPGLFVAKPRPFDGNFGIFEDSLPDGYGRYLLHKALAREGIDDRTLTALDRLSIVGCGGMGALTYEPVREIGEESILGDFDLLQAKTLEVLREKQDNDAGMLLNNSGNSGGARPKAVFADAEGHWLIKFRHTYDPLDIGAQEFRYNQVARQSGVTVPDFKLTNGKYFTTRRFDIGLDGERRHVATAGALLGVSLDEPVLDYSNLLALTGYLTQNVADVEEMYRRMLFNYLIGNKDDHCKNFSFIVAKSQGSWQWRLAPAYDLTFSPEGYNGQHATSVNGKGLPTLADFIEVGAKIKISEWRCRELISQVKSGCSHVAKYEIK